MSQDDGAAPRGLPPVPPPPADAPPRGLHVVRRLERLWARMPLRANLVLLTTALLVVGLGVAGFTTTMLISRYLVGQVDTQLTEAATQLSRTPDGLTSLIDGSGQSIVPSEYYVGVTMSDGETKGWSFKATERTYGVPNLTEAPLATSTRTETFTAEAKSDSGTDVTSRWRVIGIPVVNSSTLATGTAYVALPLDAVSQTVGKISRVLLLTGLIITATGALVAFLGVRRSLRTLSRMETTAAKIAQGDLAARVPQGPRSTEVGSLSHSLNAMLSQIETAFDVREASEARMRRFVSDASHELRTPLAAIRGYGELYRMGALGSSDELDDTMRRVEESAHRMGDLVEDLLVLARIDEGRQLQSEPVDLAALAADGAADLHALDPGRSITLAPLQPQTAPETVVPDPGDRDAAHQTPTPAPEAGSQQVSPVLVRGDEDRLRQVVMNLVGNVVRHTPGGTPVEVAVGTDPTGHTGILEVRDHGPGVPQQQMGRIFERFYRADSSRNRRSGGSGLGLAIVAAIVSALGGDASIRDTPGGGLTISITVPLLGGTTPPPPSSSGSEATGRPAR